MTKRREGCDRRENGERRSELRFVQEERRNGADRRDTERRLCLDRRRRR